MRILILLIVLIVFFALAGWITFSGDTDRSSINLETDEIRRDTGEAMHRGSELLEKAEHEVDPNTEPAPVDSSR